MAATRYMAAHPNQTPRRYGCNNWPQVLNDSGAFDLT